MFIIIGVGIFVGIFVYLYRKNRNFRKSIQLVLMHIPIFSQILIYNEVYNFTKTFASLLNHGVFITDSMEVLSKITNNEIYKELIAKTIINLNKGVNISESFKGHWAFYCSIVIRLKFLWAIQVLWHWAEELLRWPC